MKRATLTYGLIYGIAGGLLIAALRLIEYRFLVIEHSIEIYGGIVALIFASLGIWLGLRLTRKPKIVAGAERIVIREVMLPPGELFEQDAGMLRELGITPRELEILELIAGGLSNRQIADKLFVSENTVKTHSSRVLGKLNASRRTQAVQVARELRLIP